MFCGCRSAAPDQSARELSPVGLYANFAFAVRAVCDVSLDEDSVRLAFLILPQLYHAIIMPRPVLKQQGRYGDAVHQELDEPPDEDPHDRRDHGKRHRNAYKGMRIRAERCSLPAKATCAFGISPTRAVLTTRALPRGQCTMRPSRSPWTGAEVSPQYAYPVNSGTPTGSVTGVSPSASTFGDAFAGELG